MANSVASVTFQKEACSAACFFWFLNRSHRLKSSVSHESKALKAQQEFLVDSKGVPSAVGLLVQDWVTTSDSLDSDISWLAF